MKRSSYDTRTLVGIGMMGAIVVLLANTPLGLIQTPVIKATTVHIPVILGAILFGPRAGAILGGVFGLCSLISNTTAPTLLSFAFSPFLSTTGIPGALKALWISLGTRILMGYLVGLLWWGGKKLKVSQWVALPITGFVGSMLNTVLVLGSIYGLLAQEYAAAKNVPLTSVFGLIMATVTGAGVMEAVAALVCVTVVGKALLQLQKNRQPVEQL